MIQAVLLDIDGTLMTGMDPISGSLQALTYLQDSGIPFRLLSNGTRKSRISVLSKVNRIGISITSDQVFTPASAVIAYLKSRAIDRCHLISTEDLVNDFIQAGIHPDLSSSMVVVGDAADRFSYSVINQAFRSLIDGGELLALEKDRYWMDSDGLSIGAGPFVAALEFSSGITSRVMGKPSVDYYLMALAGLGASPENVVMVGDDINTDVGGAKAAGFRGVLVRTGKYRGSDKTMDGVSPDAVIDSIAELPMILNSL